MKSKILNTFIIALLIIIAVFSVEGTINNHSLIRNTNVDYKNSINNIFHELNSENEWLEEVKLIASDGGYKEYFGCAVSIDGNFAIVGEWRHNQLAGAAYIFKRTDKGWIEEQKLVAEDGTSQDYFGISVAIDGDYAIIGAGGDDDQGSYSGSAYIFKRNTKGWYQQAKLLASDGMEGDWFGTSVSILDDRAIVGATGTDSGGTAYVFKLSGSTWDEEDKLIATDAGGDKSFGISVFLDGDYAVIGARTDNVNGPYSGSAYIFKRTGSSWNEEAKLLPSDGTDHFHFGYSVIMKGDYSIIGAFGADMGKGAAYMFKRSGTNWVEEIKLTASDGENYDNFGNSVSWDEEYLVIGAPGKEDLGEHCGAAYIFKFNETGISQIQKLLPSDGAADDNFGWVVSISDFTIIIGAYHDDNENGEEAGSAYIFQREPDPEPVPLICCEGSLHWDEIEPGKTVTGQFEVCNCGEPDSLLNWSLFSSPDWGIFEILPDNGQYLLQGDCVTISVTLTVPDIPAKEFSGKIKMCNSDNSSDFCEVDVYLKTPRIRIKFNNLTNVLFSRFTNFFPTLRSLLQRLV